METLTHRRDHVVARNAPPLFLDRRVDHVADYGHIMAARPRGRDHEHHEHVFLWLHPEILAGHAVPGIIAYRAVLGRPSQRAPDRESQPKSVSRSRKIQRTVR